MMDLDEYPGHEQHPDGTLQRVRQNPCQDILPELISYLKCMYNSINDENNALRVDEEIYRFIGLKHN